MNDNINGEGFTPSRRASHGGKATPRGGRLTLPHPPRGAQSLTPSPSRSGYMLRTPGTSSPAHRGTESSSTRGALVARPGGGGSPDPWPDHFWRLLPLAEGSRRSSAAVGGGQGHGVPVAVPPSSWLASTPSSMETVKKANSPLTPFPPWENGANDGDGDGGSETELALELDRGSVGLPRTVFVQRRWALNTAMHGIVLVGQIIVTVTVACVLIAITVWQKGTTEARSWDTLGHYVQPALGLIVAVCFGTLLTHETRVLSTVAMIYLQALILTMATLTSLAVWIWLLKHEAGQLVRGTVTACFTMLLGTAAFAFFRAALVWWMVEGCGALGGSGDLFDGEFADDEIFGV